jgi:hypothetical protein
MQPGMLWQDKDIKEDVDNSISRAADYYNKKFGRKPNLCYVHPSNLRGQMNSYEEKDEIALKPNSKLSPKYLWLGIEEV